MVVLQLIKLLIDFFWQILNIPIDIGGLSIAPWHVILFAVTVAMIMNLIFVKVKEDKE